MKKSHFMFSLCFVLFPSFLEETIFFWGVPGVVFLSKKKLFHVDKLW